MKILILLHLAKATDSVSMGQISSLGATYCKRFAQKPVDSGLKNEFLDLAEKSFPTTQNIHAVSKFINGIVIRSNLQIAQNGRFVMHPIYSGGKSIVVTRLKVLDFRPF